MNSQQVEEKKWVKTLTSGKELDIVVKAHPVHERPLNTMSDFTKSFRLLAEAQEFGKLAKAAGTLLECGCHEPSENDKDYILYRIPKGYAPLRRPYRLDCDVKKCIHRAIIQKYLNMHITVRNINATNNFLPMIEHRIRDSVYKKCGKINLCNFHFEENFIEDCPDCAHEFGLV